MALMRSTLQTRITGTKGQVMGFDEDGNPTPEDVEDLDKEDF